jgi:hypothetical protein
MKVTMDEIKRFEWDRNNNIDFFAIIKNNSLDNFTLIHEDINYCVIKDIKTLKQVRNAMTDVLKELGE